MEEGFTSKRVIVLQGVRLDQSPCDTGLRTKVAVDWERDVLFIYNVVNTIGCFLVNHHNVFTGSQWELTPVTCEAWWTCALEPSVADVTHFTTRATMTTGGSLTTLVLAG